MFKITILRVGKPTSPQNHKWTKWHSYFSMAKKIAITLRKGGSGKTTTAVNLAAALQQKGKNVLLVDLDPDANATLAVGVDPTTLSKHINHLFTSIDVQPQEVITQTNFGLPILPSHPDLASTQSGMKATQVGLLRSLLAQLESSYDIIILDTPPAESYMAVNALVAADEVLIVLQAHFLALQGLSHALTKSSKCEVASTQTCTLRVSYPP